MPNEWRLAEWAIELNPGAKPVVYDRTNGNEIATVHGTDAEAFRRALLIARAPSLRDAVRTAVTVFSIMVDHGTERERATGKDMVPVMQAALYPLDDEGATPGVGDD